MVAGPGGRGGERSWLVGIAVQFTLTGIIVINPSSLQHWLSSHKASLSSTDYPFIIEKYGMNWERAGYVKTLSLPIASQYVGVRNFSPSQLLRPKNIDGINLNTEAILVSGLLIVQLWRTDFILIWKEFVILDLMLEQEF